MKFSSVMIIDDDEADRYIIKRRIDKIAKVEKYFEANDGIEAIEFFKNHIELSQKYPGRFPPFLIFLDINMPGKNGFEFLEEFNNLNYNKFDSIIFLMLTSSGQKEDIKRASSFPYVKEFIQKSIPDDELKQILEKYPHH